MMMNDDLKGLLLELVFIALLFTGALLLGIGLGAGHVRDQAVERGYAQYDSQTGEWGWK